MSALQTQLEALERQPRSFRFHRFRVQGSGLRVQGLGLRVQGLGLRVQGLGLRVQGLGLRVWGSGFRVQSSGRKGLEIPNPQLSKLLRVWVWSPRP